MRSLLATSLLALTLLLAGPGAHAGTPRASVKTLGAAAQQQVEIWRRAGVQVARIRTHASALAGRIDALKRAGGNDAELQRLLETSLAAASNLERALASQANAREDVERTVRVGVSRIDAEIRGLVPRLKTGAMPGRRAAARRINALRAVRRDLRQALTALEAEVSAPRHDWSRYHVKVEPLDGPSELAEKADFVEDTRDKLAKKRVAIARLLEEAKEERQIARAARDFDTYVRIFDEEARSDRVTRQQQRNDAVALAGNERTTDGAAAPQESGSLSTNNGQGTTDPTTGFESPPDSNSSGGRGTDDQVGGSGQTPAGPTVSAPDAPTVTRDINADVLINLRVSQLATEDLDLATLLRLVEELEDLDRFLEGQAKSIRARARTLESEDLRR